MHPEQLIARDPEILSGIPVFKGTRVPIKILFDHLERGVPIREFLDDYPTVTEEQVVGLLSIARRVIASKDIDQLYETSSG